MERKRRKIEPGRKMSCRTHIRTHTQNCEDRSQILNSELAIGKEAEPQSWASSLLTSQL